MISWLYTRPLSRVARAGVQGRWMSFHAPESPTRPSKITLSYLKELRKQSVPITVLTAYDYPTGKLCQNVGVDITLVGDSLAQVCLGYNNTSRLSLDEMIHHCKAVARASYTPLLVADMPFGTYYNEEEALRNATRLIREGRADAVKLEGGSEIAEIVQRLTSMGIMVVGHIGLLPQRQVALSGYKIQGLDSRHAVDLIKSASALEKAGAFAIVIEAVPHLVAKYLTGGLRQALTIGIGAGPGTDGQVLVVTDALGVSDKVPRFVRKFAHLKETAEEAIRTYVESIKTGQFPTTKESYAIAKDELEKFYGTMNQGRNLHELEKRVEDQERSEESSVDEVAEAEVEAKQEHAESSS